LRSAHGPGVMAGVVRPARVPTIPHCCCPSAATPHQGGEFCLALVSLCIALELGTSIGRSGFRRVGMILLVSACLAGLCLDGIGLAGTETGLKPVDFNRDILPILSDNCSACHGPDDARRMANLRLDSEEGMFADRGGYRVVVPGRSSESKLYQKIRASEPALRMPPESSGRTLTPAQIDLVGRWIDEGARYSKHWAFVVPRRPAVPFVKERSWPRNEIDHFIFARLEAEGLKPSAEADKATLLRRVTFDLTGLPPAPEDVDSFVADSSPDAYEKRVDQLLASPHYGERMARVWLDLARYADTNGYNADNLRQMWHWRDWVIQAYNQNLSYDQFTIKQIAGDLLPNASIEDRIATGFNRNHMISPDMQQARMYHAEYVMDRVNTMGTAWLGLTVGCARCHHHKYDPIKQQDFYSLYAFFNTVPERGMDGIKGNADPVLPLPSVEQEQKLRNLKEQIASTLAQVPEKEVISAQNQWRQSRLLTMLEPLKDGLMAHYEFERNLAESARHLQDAKANAQVAYSDGPVGQAAEFDETEVDFGTAGDFEDGKPFALALWVNQSSSKGVKLLQKRDGAENWKGYELATEDPVSGGGRQFSFRVVIRLARHWPDDALEVRSKQQVLPRSPTHLVVNYDGSGKAGGVSLYVDAKPVEMESVRNCLTGSFQTLAPLVIGKKDLGRPFTGQIDDLRIYSRTLPASEIEGLMIQLPARALLTELDGKPAKEMPSLQPEPPPSEPEGPITDEKVKSKEEEEAERLATRLDRQQERLSEYYLTHEAPDQYRKAYARLIELRTEKEKLQQSIPTAMVMAEMKKPRETFLLGRGQYDNPKEKVLPGVPTFLLPLPKQAPLDRLTLAKWLVDPKNPLPARVEVNRYWQAYFGTGIVKTAEDFGSQGERPSHPELLDWLATEFVRSGWDVKGMQRLIVTSATYRQSSRMTQEIIERDPENRLLSRGPRLRLTAEAIRDNALAVSGLLNNEIGGPSVFPYQPEGLWEEMAPGLGYDTETYRPGSGQDLYRRSLYTVWKRNVPPPSMATFDAPDRTKCSVRRNVTNTPLQALVLLNDPTYVEASRVLAQRTILEAGTDPLKRIDFAFRLATERHPQFKERQVLFEIAQAELAHYQQDSESALKVLGVGDLKNKSKIDPAELAAWTTVTRVILNLDETVTKQ